MDAISVLGQLHDGVFTTAEAMSLGVSRDVLAHGVRDGGLRRLARGLYATGSRPDLPEARHVELCRALLVEYPDAVLAGRSAAVAFGLPTWGVPLGTGLLHRPVDRQVRRSGAVIRDLDPVADVVATTAGPATLPAVAVVGVALDHGSIAGVVTADAALHRGLVCEADLEQEVAQRAGHRRVQQALAMLRLADAKAESPGESRLRVLLRAGGIELEPQYDVRDATGELVGRADFRVAGARVLVEFDGVVKYSNGGVDALVAEKRREDRLRALGWVVVRVTWADLAHPARVLAEVRRAMAVGERLVPAV
ncbi:type IV toxin-antitoxin system AbiEi family antitoxin domain-containing protein [Phycicoccus sp. CSK15P-2]|uniref:type IV toxin-antitoxin system AbiEi family antitoxin domain-containing protein n=1 Tax=Phycicoccus sp. CSK15P-2 TaxID=2807627 RepID=UPI00195056EF|nr:type IV toxin-antitoxin system AbiEi family antitoxin domain-containing protein [Phycicoccus sp. CSK15P-2]MBM6403823.1 type IV toxin-antitoxin system AbiEi family antitoxin domain-containing protein [Phycicoccus sp. CSK15P-2]